MDLSEIVDRTFLLYGNRRMFLPPGDKEAMEMRKKVKTMAYQIPASKNIEPISIMNKSSIIDREVTKDQSQIPLLLTDKYSGEMSNTTITPPPSLFSSAASSSAIVPHKTEKSTSLISSNNNNNNGDDDGIQWHPNWELESVISGHFGWVRSIAFDPTNEWFATGSADRTIKIWDFAKCVAGSEGGLKLTLTGHIGPVRGLAVSDRHPYLFSAGEDKQVKCWDLETNSVIRHYHGHLSGVYCLKMHPTLDILITAGRDSVARVWDMRSKKEVHVLGGHSNTIASLETFAVDPQVISGSHDTTIKLWDLVAGKPMATLTHHKKSVRAVCANPRELTFLSGAADNIKKWQVRDGKFIKNLSGQNSLINSISINEDGVAVTGGDNGSLHFWDVDSGTCFQTRETQVQPGSLDVEAGVFASTFDLSGSRFLTCEADKTIKIYREEATTTAWDDA